MKNNAISHATFDLGRLVFRLTLASVVLAALSVFSTANAAVLLYNALMDGPSESPPNASPGTGFARVDYDDFAHSMRVRANFTDLLGTTTAAHIHAATVTPFSGTAGVATQQPSFSGFPLGVTVGSMDTTFNLTLASSWNPAYVTANGGTPASAEAAFALALSQGRSYFNVHSSFRPGGEIRGFLQFVPEPATIGLASALAATMLIVRRRGG